ncbi:hypothetical protein [Pollutibacter soli]|uniref:hypothetical protein n=1 Tax=Pollutibacter soli TaxID=3034157 RepID=UPI003013A458
MQVELEAGKIYCIELAVKMSIAYARAHLNLVSDEPKKKYMNKCKPANEKKF